FQDFHRRQRLALDELQECAAASGDIGYVLSDPELVDGRNGFAPTSNREGAAVRNGSGHRPGAVRAGVELEHAHRSVPDDGFHLRNDAGKLLGCLWTNVQNHVLCINIADVLDRGRRGCREFRGYHHVYRQWDGSLLHQRLRRLDQVLFHQRLAYLVACRQQEGVGDAATDDQLVDDAGKTLQHLQLTGYLGAAHDGQNRPF